MHTKDLIIYDQLNEELGGLGDTIDERVSWIHANRYLRQLQPFILPQIPKSTPNLQFIKTNT